jgi:DNA polymerase III alpha subunit
MSYTPLRIHSSYSFRESLIRLPALVAHARAIGLGAVALIDRDNLFGARAFGRLARAQGLRPIHGAVLTLSDGTSLTLLIENAQGHIHLERLLTMRHLEGPPTWRTVAAHAEGLVAMCGGEEGAVQPALATNDFMGALAAARRLVAAFGDRAYLEAARPQPKLAALAASAGIRVAAASPVRYLHPEEAEPYLIAQRGFQRFIPDVPDHHLLNPDAWEARWRPWPEALRATEAIARRCDFQLAPDEDDGHDEPPRVFPLAGPVGPGPLALIHLLSTRSAVQVAGAGLGLPPALVDPIAGTLGRRPLRSERAWSRGLQAIDWRRQPYAAWLGTAIALEGLPDHVDLVRWGMRA